MQLGLDKNFMTPQKYLENKLKNCAYYEFSDQEQEKLKNLGLKKFLFEQITRKKFRRWRLLELARERIEKALDYCISNQKQLIFRFRFGGYKLWRLKSSPEVDWAEFFAFAHYSEYLAPIIAAHKPGVKLLFMSDDIFVEWLDNIPKSDTEAYCESFQKLIKEFKRYAPESFVIEMKRHSELFNSQEDLTNELELKMNEIKKTWKEKNPEKLKSSLATSALNIKWNGVQDLSRLPEREKKKIIERGAMMHDALIQLRTIRAFSDNNPGMIFIFTTQIPTVISIGTTKTSIAKFWVGTGVLEDREGKYFDHILTPSQIEKTKDNSLKEKPINLIPMKNFSRIKIYNNKLNFTNK